MAEPEEAEPKKKGVSLVVQLAVLLVLTGVAVGGGFYVGMELKKEATGAVEKTPVDGAGTIEQTSQADLDSHDAPQPDAHGAGHEEQAEAGADAEEAKPRPVLVNLDAVTTNLASPAETWVRMEMAVLFAKRPEPELVRQIHQDILAYMRTVTLNQVQGASGILHLKSDLEERARLRSDGQATQVVMRTLLFE